MVLQKRDERVVLGLLYLWIRDAKLELTSETASYIKDHYLSCLGDEELHFSSQEIVGFIEAYHFVQHIVRRLRQERPTRRRSGHETYRRKRPQAVISSLDSN